MAVPSDKYFPATVSCQVPKIGSLIKDKLAKEQLQIYLKTVMQMESVAQFWGRTSVLPKMNSTS
ncbi:Ulp1-like peptidase [Cucumis melo var. makuwa]|uniref:Ulp1-like peptidase n=1 Tax=Cucumis melo var. makuwa TaxID=1194695 RepID=A0A5D3DVZ8_CUCMM|nr:Ulp1-like peptidase [Cucumis melo var. makuwa]